MSSAIQEELFGNEYFTRSCSKCGGEFPRSIEFFPKGHCKDKMSSFCRKCSNLIVQKEILEENIKDQFLQISLHKKTCDECGDTKELREFYMSSKSYDGKTSACKNCFDLKYDESEIYQRSFDDFVWTVYFIQDSRNQRVKIGSSQDPIQTLNILQEGSSVKLSLLAYYDLGSKKSSEISVNSLMSLFETHHTGNCWFEMVPSLEQFITLIQSGDNEGTKILLNHKDINKKKTI